MKTSKQWAWQRSTFTAAAIVAACLALGFAPRRAHAAACVGDCDGNGQVTVNELIIMVNISLEAAPQDLTPCPVADQNGDGQVTVNEIIAAVNIALDPNGCPVIAGVCGDGVVNGTGETCDNGGICTGGSNAGTHCTAETDCQGTGICDVDPATHNAGTKYFYACNSDNDCSGGKCIHCKTFGGDGCAANCTAETDVVLSLVPGVVQGQDIEPGTSGAVPHSDVLTIPLPLGATCLGGTKKDKQCSTDADCPGSTCNHAVQTVTRGQDTGNGLIPLAVKASSFHFPRVPVSSLACACLRGVAAETCGGTLYDIDGVTPSTDCTPRFVPGTCSGSTQTSCSSASDCSTTTTPDNQKVHDCVNGVCADCLGDSDCGSGQTCVVHACDGKNPCSFLHGPGNAASGVTGCSGLSPIDVLFFQNSGGGGPSGQPVLTLSGSGGPGSTLLLANDALGSISGTCTGSDTTKYGADKEYCTDDDPQDQRGSPSPQLNTTGTATGQIQGANGDPEDNLGGPYSVMGAPVDCTALETGSLSGAGLGSTFVQLNAPILLDIIVTSDLVAQ